MANITYLLGAGASANALPVINEITQRLYTFKSEINNFCNIKEANDISNPILKPAKELIGQLDWLIEKTGSHQTIDTFARKLFAQQRSHDDLKRLKRLLSVYFLFEQLPVHKLIRSVEKQYQKKETPDKRYDSLIASLLDNQINNPDLLGNVKILTWNYDVQFELAYRNFWGVDSLIKTHKPLQIIPGKWLLDSNLELDLARFSLIHLNGVAGYYNLLKDEKTTIIDHYFNAINFSKLLSPEELIGELIQFFDTLDQPENYNSHNQETISYLNFAWESLTDDHDFKAKFVESAINNAIRIAKQTDVLVIIGYSFPIFNRQIDKKIIDSMASLKKVYIQDINPENIFTTIKNAFLIFQKGSAFDDTTVDGRKKFLLSNSLNQFVLPYEL